jgi:hypothetical protein
VPDRRYCFDSRRAGSELADVVAAHLERHARPSLRAFFDFSWNFAPVDAPAAWRGEVSEQVVEEVGSVYLRTLAYALASDDYHDVHVWAFSPQNLETILNALGAMELTDLRIEELQEPLPGSVEFYARLAKRERASPVGRIVLDLANAELRQVQSEREALRAQLMAEGPILGRLHHPRRTLRNLVRRLRSHARPPG